MGSRVGLHGRLPSPLPGIIPPKKKLKVRAPVQRRSSCFVFSLFGLAVATPAISAPADVIVGEGDGHVDLVVSLSAPGLNPVSVTYATANSTASAGTICNSDYIGASGTLNFAVGETTKVVPVTSTTAPPWRASGRSRST